MTVEMTFGPNNKQIKKMQLLVQCPVLVSVPHPVLFATGDYAQQSITQTHMITYEAFIYGG